MGEWVEPQTALISSFPQALPFLAPSLRRRRSCINLSPSSPTSLLLSLLLLLPFLRQIPPRHGFRGLRRRSRVIAEEEQIYILSSLKTSPSSLCVLPRSYTPPPPPHTDRRVGTMARKRNGAIDPTSEVESEHVRKKKGKGVRERYTLFLYLLPLQLFFARIFYETFCTDLRSGKEEIDWPGRARCSIGGRPSTNPSLPQRNCHCSDKCIRGFFSATPFLLRIFLNFPMMASMLQTPSQSYEHKCLEGNTTWGEERLLGKAQNNLHSLPPKKTSKTPHFPSSKNAVQVECVCSQALLLGLFDSKGEKMSGRTWKCGSIQHGGKTWKLFSEVQGSLCS